MTEMEAEDVVLSGFLKKSPPESKFRVSTWHRRYFVLHANKLLHYYKNEKEKRPVKEPINLRSCKCVESNLSHKSFKYVFSIVTNQRTYYLVADSKEVMETWVEKLCNVCGFQRTDGPNMAGVTNNPYFGTACPQPMSTINNQATNRGNSPSSVSSPKSSAMSPIGPCPLSVPQFVASNTKKPRSFSDPPEHDNTAGAQVGNDLRRRQSEQISSPVSPINAHSLIQAHPNQDRSRIGAVDASENYDQVPLPRPHSQEVYDILPQPKKVDKQCAHTEQVQEDYDYVLTSWQTGHNSVNSLSPGANTDHHRSSFQEDYDMVPAPRPVSQGSNRSSQEMYDFVPSPRPTSDIYVVPPAIKESTHNEYDTPPIASWEGGPLPQARHSTYDSVPIPRPASQEVYNTVPIPIATSSGNEHGIGLYDVPPNTESKEVYDWVPPPAPYRPSKQYDVYDTVPGSNRPVSADSGLNASFSSICSLRSENGNIGHNDTYDSPLPPLPVNRDSGSLSDDSPECEAPPPHDTDTQQIYDYVPKRGNEIYDVPPGHFSDVYDVPPNTSPGHFSDVYDVPPNTSSGHFSDVYDVPPNTSPGHFSDVYDVPPNTSPGHFSDVYDVPPNTSPGHFSNVYDVPPNSTPGHFSDVYDVPPNTSPGCFSDIYDVPPNTSQDIYDVLPPVHEIAEQPTVDRSSKPPPQVNRSIKPKASMGNHQYSNMPPPVNRDFKPRESTMTHSDHGYINCMKPLRPSYLPLQNVYPGSPQFGSLPNQHNRWFVPEDNGEYCEMEPTRTDFTRCYSFSKNASTPSAASEQCYEDMAPLQVQRNSGNGSSSSSSSLSDDESNYTVMKPLASLSSSLPSSLQRKRRDLQYAEVHIVERSDVKPQFNAASRKGSTHYTYINETSTKALQQMSNERKEKSMNVQ